MELTQLVSHQTWGYRLRKTTENNSSSNQENQLIVVMLIIASTYWEQLCITCLMGIIFNPYRKLQVKCCTITFIYLFILKILKSFFWLCWVFVAACGLFLLVESRSSSLLWCVGFSLRWLLLLLSTGSRHAGFSSCSMQAQQLRHAGPRARGLQWLQHVGLVIVARGLQSAGSAVVAHGFSCSEARGVFPDQGSDPCPLHWQADS